MPDKKKILVVEDEVEMSKLLRMRLEANGYDVVAAFDGKAGYEKARTENPDLIILDLMLPKMDGYWVCDILKKDVKYSSIPIIMLTAKSQENDIKMGRECGTDDYITKPFDPAVLLSKIKHLLGKTQER